MGRRRAALAGSVDSAEVTRTLLARLGLPPEASPDEARDARDRLVAFLDSAPPDLSAWARRQARAADAAVTLLSDPGTDPLCETEPEDPADGRDGKPGKPGKQDDAGDLDEDHFDEDDFDQDGKARATIVAAPSRRWRPSRIVPVVLTLVVAAVVYGVYRAGVDPAPSASAQATASPTALPSTQPLDEAKVVALMKKLDANPADVETLRALADLYFQSGDYPTAASWQRKILDRNPKDITALLTLGVALFNNQDLAGAEQQWLKVVELDPKQPEAHYDLGFLYLSKSPPDTAKAKAAWAKVIEIAPGSELAKTVTSHMDGLQNASPSPSASSSGGGK